jgi:hypothetical protein
LASTQGKWWWIVLFFSFCFLHPLFRSTFACSHLLYNTFPCKIANSGKTFLEFFSRWFIQPHGLGSVASSSTLLTRNKTNISDSSSSMERQQCSPSVRMMSPSVINIASNSLTQDSVQPGTGYMINVCQQEDIRPSNWKSHIN